MNAHTHNKKETEVLEWLYARMKDGTVCRSYSDIADGADIQKSHAKTMVEKLSSQGLLEIDKSCTPFTYRETAAGKTVLEYTEKGGGVSEESVNDVQESKTVIPSVNVHDFGVEMPLQDNQIMRENRETILNDFNLREEGDELAGEFDRFHFRISGDKVVIYVKGEYSSEGLSSVYIKNRMLQDLEKCREWLEHNLNLRFRDDVVVEGRVISQDVAIEDHPITQLAKKAGIKLTPEKFHSTDAEGNVRIKLDLSGGETGECESSMRGSQSSAARLEESDIQALCDDLLRMADNREDWNTLWSYAEDRETIFRALSYLLGKDVADSLGSGARELSEMLDNREEKAVNLEGARVSGQDTATSTNDSKEKSGRSLVDEFEFTSRWIDNHGNLMGYAKELKRPVKILDKEDVPGGNK